MSIYNCNPDTVQEPCLASTNRHSIGGLSMKFVSKKLIPISDFVTAGGLTFKIILHEMSSGSESSDDLILYTCSQSGRLPNNVDIRDLYREGVSRITDPATIARIREVAGYC